MFEDDVPRAYLVVKNDEEQFSIWPKEQALPLGWLATGFSGKKTECLAHIREIWTDQTPKSQRAKPSR